ncbi:MAG: adenylate/guanylate cyclase domain-containing protein [Methylococcales bacterium]
MSNYIPRTLIIALISALLGSGIDYLTGMETALGLESLFKLRGARTPPPEAVVVAMDEISEVRLGMGQDLTRWRKLHAQLINQLQRQGVALIVFDLQFIASQAENDPALAEAMRKAGNVLLTECVQKLRRGVEDFYGRDECSSTNQAAFVQKEGGQALSEQLVAMRKISANPLLAQSVFDLAPYHLTNDAGSTIIREGWVFLDDLAEAPTLPVLTWLVYLQSSGQVNDMLPANGPLSTWLTAQRRLCLSEPTSRSTIFRTPSVLSQRIVSIICGDDSRYLDYYGPPQTLRMESYSDVYQGLVSDLQGKVVFVGKANRQYSAGKTDFFQTPFSDTRSGKMAGVEIMATQFANLLEWRFVDAALPSGLVYFGFGLLVSLVLIAFSGFTGMGLSLLLGGGYALLAIGCFSRSGLWLPVTVPLLIQLPLCWLLSLVWSRRDLLHERLRIICFIRQVFPQWLQFTPASPGQWFPEKNTPQFTFDRDVKGLCLATDIDGYTTIAAQYTAHQMWELLNAYYQVLGHPVSSHNGIIADVTGDAMMAVWIDLPLGNQRLNACLAALEMAVAVSRFNQASDFGNLATRIGLHEGDMTLGRLDAGEGSHYRAIGDTVNIASRIQGANKFLGTQILASKGIAVSLVNVLCRPVGSFRLVGREEPVELIEIVGKAEGVKDSKNLICKTFAHGLCAFQQGDWHEAAVCFQRILDNYGDDGPSKFYLELAVAYQESPPLYWQGVVTFEEK